MVLDVNESIKELKFDLEKISEWAFQWIMQFNLDPSKQAKEVIFSRKSKVYSHPPLKFNKNDVKSSSETFRYYFRFKTKFNIHVDKKLKRVIK